MHGICCPHLGHRHLLHRVHHVRGLFTPVAFHYVTLYWGAIHWHNGMGCWLMGVKPVQKQRERKRDRLRTCWTSFQRYLLDNDDHTTAGHVFCCQKWEAGTGIRTLCHFCQQNNVDATLTYNQINDVSVIPTLSPVQLFLHYATFSVRSPWQTVNCC